MKYTDDRQNLDFPNLCFVGPYLKIEAQIFVLNMFALHCAKLIILYIKIITVFSAFAKYLFLEFCHFYKHLLSVDICTFMSLYTIPLI